MGKIWIAGLGPGDGRYLPGITGELLRTRPVFLRTVHHPLVKDLQRQGIKFTSFDHYYEEKDTFEEVYQAIVDELLEAAREAEEMVYAVPGHPLVAEDTVTSLLRRAREAGLAVEVVPAPSCLEAICRLLEVDPAGGMLLLDALRLQPGHLSPGFSCIILQLHSPLIAAETKLTLMEAYPDDYEVVLVHAAGVLGQEMIRRLPLYALDRQPGYDYLTSLYLPPAPGLTTTLARFPLDPLVDIMAKLRSPGGCPWDREQTHASLKRYLLEETYEVIDAIDREDMASLREELGDLLLQVVFHAQLARERGAFAINDVIQGITAKMRFRHPHVFGEVNLETASEVVANWDRLKRKEKTSAGLVDVPGEMPALMRAQAVQERAGRVGFDWPVVDGVWDKIAEEERELRAALAAGDRQAIQDETGDLFFAFVNLARHLGVEAEDALRQAVDRFVCRFRYMEEAASRRQLHLADISSTELERLWEEAKAKEK